MRIATEEAANENEHDAGATLGAQGGQDGVREHGDNDTLEDDQVRLMAGSSQRRTTTISAVPS